MSDDQATEEEPSIEEILDSIRQIISDEDEEEGAAPAAPEPEPAPEPVPEPEPTPIEPEDVIELTDPLDQPEPEPIPEPEPEPEPIEEPEVMQSATRVDPLDDESILTSNAQTAAYDGFAELARKTSVENGGITLEEIVRTELNPLLRDWLDRNLPNIIDRLVREELERISKRAESDVEDF